jgi:arabinogalactan endo-1,4-beta-galactosidase
MTANKSKFTYMKKAIVDFRFVLTIVITLLINFCIGAQTTEPSTFAFSKGADVSWLPQMEATGYKFYDSDGSEKDCLQLLKDRGINTIRLRVFVNPSNDKTNGHCSPAETVALAVRAKNMGMRIMINFHYSDTWADPGHQTKPAAWASHSFSDLQSDVYNHTYDVLNALKIAGVTPEWVQIGNEIPGGMLWPEGSTSNWNQLAQLLNKGYDATKAIDSNIKVIIHIDQGNSNARFRWFFDNVKRNNIKYDVIGMSYYPYWLNSDYTVTIANLENNLKDMVVRYGKEVMVVEVGGDYTKVQNTYDMLSAVIAAVKKVPDNKGLGVIYWEPQGEKSWSGYQLNAWLSNGRPSPALDAFKIDSNSVIEQVQLDGFAVNPIEQGKNVSTNLTYSANTATSYFYVGLFKRNASGEWLQTIAESSGNQFLVPSVGANLLGQVNLAIPMNTTPTTSLTNGEYYDIYVELWTANWGIKLGSSLSSKLTIAAAGSLSVDELNLDKKFVLYPNPVSNILSFNNSNNVKIESLKITNILGETVFFDENPEDQDAIDVSKLSFGMYILSIDSQNGTQQYKFIKN